MDLIAMGAGFILSHLFAHVAFREDDEGDRMLVFDSINLWFGLFLIFGRSNHLIGG